MTDLVDGSVTPDGDVSLSLYDNSSKNGNREISHKVITNGAPPSEESKLPPVEQIVDDIGIGPFQWRIFIICGLFFFADIMEIQFLTYLKMAFANDEDVSSWWVAAIGTSVFAGMLVGASSWGYVADRFGRKRGLFIVAVFISVFGLVSMFAPNVQTLVILRAMVGFGLGGSHISVTVLMEMVPPDQRNNMLNMFQGFQVLGVWAEAGLAWAFMDMLGWRYVALFTSVPSFLALILIYWLPESPLWLVVARRPKDAAEILRKIAAFNQKKVDIDEEKLAGMIDFKLPEHQADYRQLFSRYLWKSTILVWVLWFGNSTVYYGLMLLTPEYLAESGSGYIYRDMFISTLAELPALLLSAFLLRKIGLYNAQAVFFCGSMVLAILVGVSKDVEGKVIAIVMSTLIRLFTSGSFYTTYTLTPSIYPTSIRGIGFGAGSSMSRIGGMVTPFIANLTSTHLLIPCSIYAATAGVATVAAGLLNITTRWMRSGGQKEVETLLPNKK